MEVLLQHYAFGKPKHTYVEPAGPKQSDFEQALERMTTEEIIQMDELQTRIREMKRLALARPMPPLSNPERKTLFPPLPADLRHGTGTEEILQMNELRHRMSEMQRPALARPLTPASNPAPRTEFLPLPPD